MKFVRFLLVALCVVAAASVADAQRTITPVKAGSKNIVGVNENKAVNDTIHREALIETVNDAGRKVFVDTISGREVPDSLVNLPETKGKKMTYPLLYSASVGVDVWEPVMRLFGQKHGVIGFSAELNLHNRYIPVVEVGLGSADNTPAGQNFTYHTGLTPYFRVGMNYNFLFNGNPDYQFFAGVRLGWSRFNYQLRDVTIDDSYWQEEQVVDFPKQTSSATYLNVLVGLKVKVWGPVSVGWNLRVRSILHETAQPDGKPWYIPGYGSRNGILTGSFSVFYNFSFAKKKAAAEPVLPAEAQ
jgi:hypothetical protein